MSELDESLKANWSDLLAKLDKLYESNEVLPFEIDLDNIQNAQDVFNHKSHLLENTLLLKQIEAIFIDTDLIEEKKKARLQSLKSSLQDDDDNTNKRKMDEDMMNSVSAIASEPLSPENNKVSKTDEDRRKKLLSSLPSQPRKLAEAAAAAATSPTTSTGTNKLLNINKNDEIFKKDTDLNIGVTSTTSTISEKISHTGLNKLVKEQNKEMSLTDDEPIVTGKTAGKSENTESKINRNKKGVSAYTNSYNPKSCYITVGSTVAYKPKLTSNGGSMKRKIPDDMADWFQCIVLKILNDDGTRFEIQDIEAAESGLDTSIYRCNSREIIHIPLAKEAAAKHQVLKNYPTGMKCLGKYPDTTTFYPAVVIGKRMVNNIWYSVLRFDGEEEVNKETLVERQYVLLFPKK